MDYKSILDEIIEILINEKKIGVCLLSSCLMDDICKLKGLKCDMIKGYVMNPDTKKYMDHIWIEADGIIYDSTKPILENFINIRVSDMEYSKEIPNGYLASNRDNEEDIEITDKLLHNYKFYMSNPDKFWKDSPAWIKKIRLQLRKKFQVK